MAYALHRRAAFRQGVSATGWNFDLTKSEYVNSAALLNSTSGSVYGNPISPRHLALNTDSSSIFAAHGAVISRYDFPFGHYGDIYHLQNAYASTYKTYVAGSGSRAFSFSQDGLHFVRHGAYNDSKLYSCSLNSAFDISSIKNDTDMAILDEFTSNSVATAFSLDGEYIILLFSNVIRSYYLQSQFDVSSASLVFTQISLSRFYASCGIPWIALASGNMNHFVDWQFSPDGFTLVGLWVYSGSSDQASYGGQYSVFFVFKLSVPFNISTISLDHVWDFFGDKNVTGFTIDREGQNLYVARPSTVLQYALSA